MTQNYTSPQIDPALIGDAIEHAVRQIPPVWPLASSVAVNPFLGQTAGTLTDAGARLERVGGVPVTMPRSYYQAQIESGAITRTDLEAALAACRHANKPASADTLILAAQVDQPAPCALPTVAELAAKTSGTDWPAIIADRFAAWAASYFDQGQALWPAIAGRSAWATWVTYATHDLTPEIMGVSGFARIVAEAPEHSRDQIARAVATLQIEADALPTFFHQMLFSLGGWAQYARYLLWQAELAGGTDTVITDLLAIRLLWEETLYLQHREEIGIEWARVRSAHAEPVKADDAVVIDTILQAAAERAAQRQLADTLAMPGTDTAGDDRPELQAAFCIDVRSEVFRRALESVNPAIRTIGFAGFFGVSTQHRGFASDVAEHRLPVLLNPAVSSVSGGEADSANDLSQRFAARAKRAWGRFKLAAVSSFAFVEATGPLYVFKLLRDALGLARADATAEPTPRFSPELDLESRIGAAQTVLRAMSLTSGFGRIVLLAGHGANVTNNPHKSGLHCGACGGYSGEVNARLLAALLNEPAVRAGLAERGINIPQDTTFVAGLHDTTTDRITIYDQDLTAAPATLAQVREWLSMAGQIARAERAPRLPRAQSDRDIARRALDWAEVRPEWALAGCKAFIAAPRHRTSRRELEGRAFLHDYDWRLDRENGYGVLELIMTAPVVVASWISLQYYGSSVAQQAFGSGNKLLHNVVGGIGVFEGNGGNMRAGLSMQSVHDGEALVHEPLRLSVCIEAPTDAMTAILEKHPQVRELFDNGWLHLFAIDDSGGLAKRYVGDLEWADEVQSERENVLVAA